MIIVPTRYRSLFISDFHLGSLHCQVDRLCKFLLCHDAECIYLVGDIIDGSLYNWPPFHDNVLRILAEKSISGTKIVYVPGNHDRMFREHVGSYGNFTVAEYVVHERVDGEKMLVIHGDETDLFQINHLLWLIIKIETLIGFSIWEWMRKHFGPMIRSHTAEFENKIMALALERGFTSVVCGHVHYPDIVDRGALYLNPGDWTWHCTAIAEDHNGSFTILQG